MYSCKHGVLFGRWRDVFLVNRTLKTCRGIVVVSGVVCPVVCPGTRAESDRRALAWPVWRSTKFLFSH
jgi:hypothetical protein